MDKAEFSKTPTEEGIGKGHSVPFVYDRSPLVFRTQHPPSRLTMGGLSCVHATLLGANRGMRPGGPVEAAKATSTGRRGRAALNQDGTICTGSVECSHQEVTPSSQHGVTLVLRSLWQI